MGLAVSICGCGMREDSFARARNKQGSTPRDRQPEGSRPGELPWHFELGVTMWREWQAMYYRAYICRSTDTFRRLAMHSALTLVVCDPAWSVGSVITSET